MAGGTRKLSARLRRVVDYLKQRGEVGATTRQIVLHANVCAVNSIVSELRAIGYRISCKCETSTELLGVRRVYRYKYLGYVHPRDPRSIEVSS